MSKERISFKNVKATAANDPALTEAFAAPERPGVASVRSGVGADAPAIVSGHVTRDRATTWWGIGAVIVALSTSVFAAGSFLYTRSLTSTSVQTSRPVLISDESLPGTNSEANPTSPRLVPASLPATAPEPILTRRSTRRNGWAGSVLFAGLVLVASLPLLARKSRCAQKVRVWTAMVFGLGVVVALASIGLFYLPTFGALVMAARTGRHRPPNVASTHVPTVTGTS